MIRTTLRTAAFVLLVGGSTFCLLRIDHKLSFTRGKNLNLSTSITPGDPTSSLITPSLSKSHKYIPPFPFSSSSFAFLLSDFIASGICTRLLLLLLTNLIVTNLVSNPVCVFMFIFANTPYCGYSNSRTFGPHHC